MIQNEVNEAELSFPPLFRPNCLVVSGGAYIIEGRQEGKDLTIKVEALMLPNGQNEDKNALLKMKFKQMCQNISAGKESVGYDPRDFLKYDCVYTPN